MAEKEDLDQEDQVPTEELWERWQESGEEEVKMLLVERYQPLVGFIAARMAASLPRSVDVNDLIQEGNFGLMDGIEKFDPERGFKFKTYCSTRIRGAMLDALRSQDWVPRLVRQRASKMEKARAEFLSRFGREPTDAEIIDSLGVETKELQAMKKAKPRAMLSISDKPSSSKEGEESGLAGLGESKEMNPFDAVDRKDLMDVITRSLSEKERAVLQLYYIEGLTLREVGAALNITESRVCQIHGNVIKRLKERLRGVQSQLRS